MRSRVLVPAILACATLAYAIGAQAQSPSRPGPEQKCNRSFADYLSPSLDTLLDEGAVMDGLVKLVERGREIRSGFLSIEFRRSGGIRQIDFDAMYVGETKREIDALLRQNVRTQPAQRENFFVGLWIDGGRAPSLRPLRMTAHCPAEVNDRAVFTTTLYPQLVSLGMQGFLDNRSTYRTRIRFRVAPSGLPTDIALVQSSANPQFDKTLLSLVEILRFYPALHDGAPVEQWMLVPVGFFIR